MNIFLNKRKKPKFKDLDFLQEDLFYYFTSLRTIAYAPTNNTLAITTRRL